MHEVPELWLAPHLPGGLKKDDFETRDGSLYLKPGTRFRWLEEGETPTLPYYVEFADGRRAEAATPHQLMNILIHPEFTQVREFSDLYHYFTLKRLHTLAAVELPLDGIRATVYDALGPFYDPMISRKPDEEENAEFVNKDEPVIIDGYNWWTAVAEMIRLGYIRLYEKIPTWSDSAEKKKEMCRNCVFKGKSLPPDEEGDTPFWCHAWEAVIEEAVVRQCPYVSTGPILEEYRPVDPERMPDPAVWMPDWKPVSERTQEYEGFRNPEGFKRTKTKKDAGNRKRKN